MRPRVAEIGQYPVTPEIIEETVIYGCDTRIQPWKASSMAPISSGSSRAERGVDPTRSQIKTLRWRRSAAVGTGAGSLLPLAPKSFAAAGLGDEARALIAFMRRFLSPSGIPNFSVSCSVSSGKTSMSIAFSAKAEA